MDNSQITTALPLKKMTDIVINENKEPLVEIFETENIKLLTEHKFLSPYLRKTARDLLATAAKNLPSNYILLVVTAYRPIWMQKKLWRRRLLQMAKKYPFKMIFQYSRWRKMVSQYTAPPGGSSHQYGGAVDVIVIDGEGKRLDMGTTLTDFGEKVNTYSRSITEKQKENRKVLYDAMTKAGFVNYPMEWWHYSYGDRMWAAYKGKDECFYGRIEE
jgi:D-alanyl-D-alanine dipeptidase